jgi:cytochrome c556
MSCAALALAAALTAAPTAAPAGALTREPLFADIVSRAERLEAEARTFKGRNLADLDRFKGEVARLAELDMQGHVTLRERGTDGDLKCILKGISQDLPKKLEQLEAAKDDFHRGMAVDELVALLDDNQAVVTQPPGPATPPPAES